ncbi:MAG: tetratricopeptide repeat protein, partial [Planctomycetota bacterium]|nr:tetratricopeptide repeat protein [Planctomycetota bacterium]
NNRGVVHLQLSKFDEAISDFTGAIKIDSKYVEALENRAYAYVQKNDHTKAIADLEYALQLSSHSYEAANDLAWLLATSPDPSIRNTKRALELAKLACDLTQYQQWNTLDTLAVVYAENGQFADAKKMLVTALKLAPADEQVRIQNHLDLVAAGKPVRD